MLKIDQRTTRAMNRRLVLNLLRREGSLSRVEIAEITGLSRATVTFVVGDLIAENYLIEGETVRGAGGRRPIPLAINYGGHLAIGIKMNVGSLECILTDGIVNLTAMRTYHDAGRVCRSRSGDFRPQAHRR